MHYFCRATVVGGRLIPKKSSAPRKAIEEFGAKLRAARISRGVSQVELAQLARTTQSRISSIELGVAGGLTVAMCARLAEALNSGLILDLAPRDP